MMMSLHRVLAVNPLRPIQTAEQFWGYIADNYYGVLSTLRCPCSGEPKPCLSGQFLFEDAIEQQTLSDLHIALGAAITAVQKNYNQITDVRGPRVFFETLKSVVVSGQVPLKGPESDRQNVLVRLDEILTALSGTNTRYSGLSSDGEARILTALSGTNTPTQGCCVVS